MFTLANNRGKKESGYSVPLMWWICHEEFRMERPQGFGSGHGQNSGPYFIKLHDDENRVSGPITSIMQSHREALNTAHWGNMYT